MEEWLLLFTVMLLVLFLIVDDVRCRLSPEYRKILELERRNKLG